MFYEETDKLKYFDENNIKIQKYQLQDGGSLPLVALILSQLECISDERLLHNSTDNESL